MSAWRFVLFSVGFDQTGDLEPHLDLAVNDVEPRHAPIPER